MRIGLLGGSFNPPHAAHRAISLLALKRLGLGEVWWLVSPGNPLKDHADLAPLRERLRACRAIAKDRRIKITAVEAALSGAYTASTVGFLRRRFPGVRFVWLMGADNLVTFHHWHNWRTIFTLVPIAVADRPNMRHGALASLAGRRFSRFRLPEHYAPLLADLPPPVWCLLSGPLSDLSSTILRRAKS